MEDVLGDLTRIYVMLEEKHPTPNSQAYLRQAGIELKTSGLPNLLVDQCNNQQTGCPPPPPVVQ